MDNFDDDFEEDEARLSLLDIYNQLLTHKEIIITVPIEEEDKIRTGLASVKAKQSKKLRDNGFTPGRESLSYQVSPNADAPKAHIDMKILLKERTTINVVSMKLPDATI